MFSGQDAASKGIDTLTESITKLLDKLTDSDVDKSVKNMRRLSMALNNRNTRQLRKNVKMMAEKNLAIPVSVQGQVQMKSSGGAIEGQGSTQRMLQQTFTVAAAAFVYDQMNEAVMGKVKREAEFNKTAGGGGSSTIVDAKKIQTTTNMTTGKGGPITHNKFGNLNKSLEAAGF